MRRRVRRQSITMKANLAILLLVSSVVMAGCSSQATGSSSTSSVPEPKQVQVTDTTGGIRGVVVDQAIRPIKAASVNVNGGSFNKNFTTDEGGGFVVSGLKPGTYFMKASKPLYDTQQQSVEVKAGVAPGVTKIQLNQVVFSKPYLETFHFKGFLVCSQDFSGKLFSEECGQGVGAPCETDPVTHTPVPPPGCSRVGGQAGNAPQFDFYPTSDHPQSLIVELAWTPTVGAATTGALWTPVAKNWVCDPTCNGVNVANDDNAHFGNCATSPSYIRDDKNVQDPKLNLTAATKITTFTWACGKGGAIPPVPVVGQVGYDIELNQEFQEFVTLSYILPLPDDWSFIKGSPDPFTGS